MKIRKTIFTLLLTAVFSMPVYALDVIVGAKGGYFIWKPYFEDIGGFFEPIDQGTGVLYGPAASIIFSRDISLSIVGLTGKQSTYWSLDFEQEGNDSDDVRAATYTWESKRYDIDSALSYRVLPYLKAFIGYKYQNISSRMRYTEVRVDSTGQLREIYHDNAEAETMSHGPAFGLGYSLLFSQGFFTTINASGLYMTGNFHMKPATRYDYYFDENDPTTTFVTHLDPDNKVDIRQIGTNVEPSIGYMPDGSRLIFTLGFRYQWLSTKFKGLTEQEKQDMGTQTMHDYLYGVFVSVLYSF
ncbi:MAG: hypothetical protein JW864_11310 [Spirochaetes bacterium]|nr:hypothetical protein [Spirochaetota bacterium]